MRLRVYTQNCYGLPLSHKFARFPKIRQKIVDLQPDIVCLQEVVFNSDARFFDIPGYHQYWVPGLLVTSGGLLILSKYPCESAAYHKYSSQGHWLSAHLAYRFVGAGFLELRLPELDITILNTHLAAFYEIKSYVTHDMYQEAQLRELLAYVQTHEKVILAGDFNFVRESQNYTLSQEHGLYDLVNSLSGPTWENYFVDYIFTNIPSIQDIQAQQIDFTPVKWRKKTLPVTDHVGLLVELEI